MEKEHNEINEILGKCKDIETLPHQKNKESIFPMPLRCLIVGSSGSRKTSLLLYILENCVLRFENIYFFTKNIDQLAYKKIEEIFNGIDEIEIFISNEGIVSVDECRPNSLVIFDDYVLGKQSIMKEYFMPVDLETFLLLIYLLQ